MSTTIAVIAIIAISGMVALSAVLSVINRQDRRARRGPDFAELLRQQDDALNSASKAYAEGNVALAALYEARAEAIGERIGHLT